MRPSGSTTVGVGGFAASLGGVGPHADHEPPHTCTSWYVCAAMFGSPNDINDRWFLLDFTDALFRGSGWGVMGAPWLPPPPPPQQGLK